MLYGLGKPKYIKDCPRKLLMVLLQSFPAWKCVEMKKIKQK